MHYTSGPGFNSRWRPNIFNSVLFKKASERERIHLIYIYIDNRCDVFGVVP